MEKELMETTIYVMRCVGEKHAFMWSEENMTTKMCFSKPSYWKLYWKDSCTVWKKNGDLLTIDVVSLNSRLDCLASCSRPWGHQGLCPPLASAACVCSGKLSDLYELNGPTPPPPPTTTTSPPHPSTHTLPHHHSATTTWQLWLARGHICSAGGGVLTQRLSVDPHCLCLKRLWAWPDSTHLPIREPLWLQVCVFSRPLQLCHFVLKGQNVCLVSPPMGGQGAGLRLLKS